jgi:diguanylate cyclase (GGDEF)-like protein/PAS domain S-box-containing protein
MNIANNPHSTNNTVKNDIYSDNQLSGDVIMLTANVSELRYRHLFETTQDGILILDGETGAVTDVNPSIINMLGYSREELVAKKLWEIRSFKDIEASQETFEALRENEQICYENLPLRAKDGKLIRVEFICDVYFLGMDKVIQCNIRDITEQIQAQEALSKSKALLQKQPTRDHLTGLFSRRYMEETLDRELLKASRNKNPLGIIMLEVDYFKHIQDTWGHVVGETILHKLSNLLLDHVRGEDIPSRYEGDEFVIVMPDSSQEVTRNRAELLHEHVHHFHIQIEGQTIKTVTLSLGVAVFPQNGFNSSELLNAASNALYQAKHEGRDKVIVANGNLR